ncbi:MAG TPA: hypothetical protein PKA39_07450, partial [Ignavibacteria bacterium]|nr:hypothetical protein [Ignavibacteria bacterium]
YLTNPIFETECSRPDEAINLLDGIKWIKSTAFFGEYIHVTLNNTEINNWEQRKNEIKDILEKGGLEVKRIERISPSLEDVFVNLLEKDK